MKVYLFFFLFLFAACSNDQKVKEATPFSPAERKTVEEFAYKLTESINKYEYDLVRNSWDKEAFRKRVTQLDESEQSVFNQYYEKELSTDILNVNIDLVNKLKYNNGRLILSKLTFTSNYAEIVFSMIFSGNVDFWKYRVELCNNVPKLTDYYVFRDEIWQSENMKNVMNLNSRYRASSKERRQTNNSILESDRYASAGDPVKALDALYNIPETHVIGNSINLKRINLAFKINDSVYASTLEKEKKINNGIYVNYLYCYYFRKTDELNKIFSRLENEVGKDNEILDSLKTLNYFWQ